MIRRFALLAFACCLVGCSADPATSSLKAGQIVLLHDDKETKIYVGTPALYVGVPVGIKARVARDTNDDASVFVILLEGQYQGQQVDVSRANLRPASD